MPAQDAQPMDRTDLVVDRAASTIRLTRVFEAAREDIFEAWTKPEHVARWWDPAGEPLVDCRIDLRIGGAFRFVSKGHPEMPFDGVYAEISPPGRLAFEANGARGLVTLEAVEGKTHMTVEIACRSPEHLDQYVQFGVHTGTARTMDNLVAYADGRFAAAA